VGAGHVARLEQWLLSAGRTTGSQAGTQVGTQQQPAHMGMWGWGGQGVGGKGEGDIMHSIQLAAYPLNPSSTAAWSVWQAGCVCQPLCSNASLMQAPPP
jgi:hypothetical protein